MAELDNISLTMADSMPVFLPDAASPYGIDRL